MRASTVVLIMVVLTLLGVNAFFVFRSLRPPQAAVRPTVQPTFDAAQAYILPITEASYIPVLDSAVPAPALSGKSVLVYDARSSRFLLTKNMREKLPVASLTKVMSAVIVMEYLKMDDVVTVTGASVRVDGQKQDLFADEQITVGNLLKMMLVSSSNDAAYALAAYARSRGIDFVALMNKKAEALSMTDSYFLNPAGLDDRAFSTAYDMLKIVRYSMQYQAIWDSLVLAGLDIPSIDGKIVHRIKNTNQLLGTIPNIVGGKTGYTESAMGCMILLVDVPGEDDTIISIVIGSQERFGDTKKIIEWVQAAYNWN